MAAILGTGRTVPDVCRTAELPDEALALLGDGNQPRAFVEALAAAGQHAEAIRFLAHALDPRPAVWWAWVCARRAHGETPPDPIQASLEATKAWIADPSDANCRAAMAKAEAADLGTPAGCAGLAAFFCGDSIAPKGSAEPVPPPAHVAARAIAGCVILAAVGDPPENAPERFREYLTQGLEVADKTSLWTPPAPSGKR